MVCVRLVDLPDSPEEPEVGAIPEMMFAVGEEPVGVRVLTYLSSGILHRIYNSLDDEEVEIIRGSSFGKILDIVDKPVFSGRFARYMLSRQLKTRKKHEAWFRFAGKPIRFSLREFAIVTGLPCGRFPSKSKMKLKATITEKPYWPTLFGKIEVVTVASVIRMLRKRTVEDRVVRVKYACLAILSSVLLPTNLKMKLCRDHVEAIADLDEFFAYPWGRLAFDMLMCSIKERDEVALSQDTIAVKGFALALQLVMVEAVPSLNEVVQETCSSSSEGESEDDVYDKSVRTKRKTLSPAHARNEDKRIQVLVRSIIDADPSRPIDESQLVWSDDEEDEKVENMVRLIHRNFQFHNSMFLGGLTRLDVHRMRDSIKLSTRQRKQKKHNVLSGDTDPLSIASLVIEKIQPQFHLVEGNIVEACGRIDSIEGTVLNIVNSVLPTFKEEIMDSVKKMVGELITNLESSPSEIAPHVAVTSSKENGNMQNGNGLHARDANVDNIEDVLGNLSAYSTPPVSPLISLGENISPPRKNVVLNSEGGGDAINENFAISAHSENHHVSLDLNQPVVCDNQTPGPFIEMPSFSLGLTQEEQLLVAQGRAPMSSAVVGDNIEDPKESRRSKRQKCVPQALVVDYECGRDIVSRVRKSHKFIFAFDDTDDIDSRYATLTNQLSQHGFINVGGVAVRSKDIILIGERRQLLSSKVVDVLLRLLKCSIEQQYHPDFYARDVFLDSKYVTAIGRTYPRFSKSRKKDDFIFPKGLVGAVGENTTPILHRQRFYFPLNVCKKHWIGVCVDPSSMTITVLDCNTSIFSDAMLEKYLTPHLVMLPHLLRLTGTDRGVCEKRRLACERPKGLSQTIKPEDSGLMSVLFIATHAIYGLEACKKINSNILAEEGKSAVLLAFELDASR